MSHFMFPKLTDEKQFEHLVADCYRALYPESQVDEYGRRGQKQYGIDITVQMKVHLWCIQCKNYETISVSHIDDLLRKCTYYDITPFSKSIIATAALNDTKIVDYLVKLRKDHIFPFDLEYLSWERICDLIANNSSVYEKYYNSLKQVNAFKCKFLKIVKRYNIGAFLRIDPMINGLNSTIPFNLDCCKIKLENLLDNYIERNNDVLYSKINEFMNWLDAYNGNLSVILFPSPNEYGRFVYLPPINGIDEKRREKEQMVLQFREHLINLMNEIAAYME